MKILNAMCVLSLLCCPLGGEDRVIIPDSTAPSFIPLLPDSLNRDSVGYYILPKEKPYFQYETGILHAPDPYHVELNPGGIHAVDPTVDLEMIYPLASRQKILLQKNDLDKLPHKPNSWFYFKPEIKKRPQDRKEKE
ncbi:hypothetical protein JW998_06815 [candidate division KSB1 bacterium]|nr:hypothetical protein [candidate division KSB1 bacterium]